MGNQCGVTPSDPYHVNLCLLSYIIEMFMNMFGGEKDKEYMGNDPAKRERG